MSSACPSQPDSRYAYFLPGNKGAQGVGPVDIVFGLVVSLALFFSSSHLLARCYYNLLQDVVTNCVQRRLLQNAVTGLITKSVVSVNYKMP